MEIIKARKMEEERLRQLLMADDFKEKALINMMDGVLEKLWEDEIKKDIPKPKCMVSQIKRIKRPNSISKTTENGEKENIFQQFMLLA